MIASNLKAFGLTFALVGGVATAHAADAPASSVASTEVPVEITFHGVRAGTVPFYVSIQTETDYRSMKGTGGIVTSTQDGTFTQTFSVPESGDYAVTVWHDLDDDGRFSMTSDYQVMDGWGSSGTIPRGTSPSFAEASVSVPNFGTSVEIEMIYPES
ncbi:MAG: DUF2141 domain-containing protein [Litorimonas sp.]